MPWQAFLSAGYPVVRTTSLRSEGVGGSLKGEQLAPAIGPRKRRSDCSALTETVQQLLIQRQSLKS